MNDDRFFTAASLRHPAVVPGVAGDAGLGIVRSLAVAGIPVLALDADPRAAELHTRRAATRVCPDPEEHEEALIAYLERLGATLPGRAVLLPAGDRYVAAVSRQMDRLQPWYFVPVAHWDALGELVRHSGVSGTAGDGAGLVADVRAGTDDRAVYASYLDAQSRPLAQFTGRSLRQDCSGSGLDTMVESVWLPEIAEVGLRLLHEAGLQGISVVEFRRDPGGAGLRLWRAGACDGLWLSLSASCGVDLALTAYRDAIGEPYLTPRQSEGRKQVRLLMDVREGLARWRRGQEPPASWFRSYRGVTPSHLDAVLDPVPGALRTWRRLFGTGGEAADPDRPRDRHV